MSGNYEKYHIGGGKLKESLLDLTFTWKICWSPGEPTYCFPTYGRSALEESRWTGYSGPSTPRLMATYLSEGWARQLGNLHGH